jgi:hypothetical protein
MWDTTTIHALNQKPVQFLWVESHPSGGLVWDKLTDPVVEKPDPAVFAGHLADRTVHGQLRLENELQVTLIFTGDEESHRRVDQLSRDTVALVQEHMIPIPFVFVKTHADKLAHLARTGDPGSTLCGREVRRMVNATQADRCPDCARLATKG